MWLIVAGVAVLAVAFLLWRARSAGGSTFNTSGTPGPDATGSGAPAGGGGGASSTPANLPPILSSSTPDTLTQQVQQADAGASSTQSATTAAATTTAPWSSYSPTPATVNGTPVTQTAVIGGVGYEQSAPGSDYLVPVPLSEAAPTSNIHRPGAQL